MMFISIHHVKDFFFELPKEKQVELMMGAFACAEKYIKNGKCKVGYVFSDGKGTASVWDVDSAEEWMNICFEYPMNEYIEVENIPIVGSEFAHKTLKQMVAAAKKAAKK
jgi:hypothetical protein